MSVAETAEVRFNEIIRQVKLIIWDLDDTFWEGTLSEGPISIIERNVVMIKTLAERGIISSICSKNDFEPTQQELVKCGAWDYFVFSKIDFTPKGARIAALIEEMNLRAENVLFIDDNIMNLREVAFAAPGIMVAYPHVVLDTLLDHAHLKGKPDPAMKRLLQYKQLQQKVVDQSANTTSNEDFLRSCDIKVRIIYDLDPLLDRLVDLINRSNQLNFTKKRIPENDTAAFAERLRARDVYAGAVSVEDRYGDYGVVGFFLHVKDPVSPHLEQFVFSCRTMHMGIEQYVYEHLGKPPIEVVRPVSNEIVAFDRVDWISEADGESGPRDSTQASQKLVLVGGCDLLQVSSYLSRNRVEFVNDVRDGVVIRYDDFGFVLDDRYRVESSAVLPKLPCWTAQEAMDFDRQLEDAEIVMVSLWVALRGYYLATDDGLAVRVHPYGFGEYLDHGRGAAFLDQVGFHKLDAGENAALLESAILKIAAASPNARQVLLGANTRVIDPATPKEDRAQRVLHNAVCRRLAEQNEGFDYIDIDTLIDLSQMVDEWHYTRLGYLQLAEEVKKRCAAAGQRSASLPQAKLAPVFDVVQGAQRVGKTRQFGPVGHGLKARVKDLMHRSPSGRAAFSLAKSVLKRPAKAG